MNQSTKLSCLAIIPARGGSKRIPKKNIKTFLGKPIIAYSIETAYASNCFDSVIVSTEDVEISEIARQWGAKVPFFRSKETADDYATLSDVLLEVLKNNKNHGKKHKYVCCILATAPLLEPQYLQEAYNLLIEKNADTVFSVSKYSYPIQRALKLTRMGKIIMYNEDFYNTRSNDLEDAYHDAGQFYWLNVDKFFENKVLFTNNSFPYILSEKDVQDIDNYNDWEIAELKYKNKNQ